MLLKILVSEDDFGCFGALAEDYQLAGSRVGYALPLDIEVKHGGAVDRGQVYILDAGDAKIKPVGLIY